MKHMFWTVLLVSMVVVAPGYVWAQAGQSGPKMFFKDCKNIPDLTGAQKSEMGKIKGKYQPIFQQLRENYRNAANQAQAEQVQQSAETKIREAKADVRALLTPAQQGYFDQNIGSKQYAQFKAKPQKGNKGKDGGKAKQDKGDDDDNGNGNGNGNGNKGKGNKNK